MRSWFWFWGNSSTFSCQFKTENSSFSVFTFDAYSALHFFDQLLTNAEAKPSSSWINFWMFIKLWKILEKFFKIFWLYSYSCILNFYFESYIKVNLFWISIFIVWILTLKLTLTRSFIIYALTWDHSVYIIRNFSFEQ